MKEPMTAQEMYDTAKKSTLELKYDVIKQELILRFTEQLYPYKPNMLYLPWWIRVLYIVLYVYCVVVYAGLEVFTTGHCLSVIITSAILFPVYLGMYVATVEWWYSLENDPNNTKTFVMTGDQKTDFFKKIKNIIRDDEFYMRSIVD